MILSIIGLIFAAALFLSAGVLAATDLPPWVSVSARSGGVFIAALSLLFLGIHLWRTYGHLLKSRPKPASPPPDPAAETMDRLARLLAKIEPNSAAAEARLQDAKIAAETLMKQALRVVERIEELERQATFINQAADAIKSGQRDQVAYLAGKVGDDSLRTMPLSPYLITRSDFRTEAFILLASERGALEESAAGYGRLVTALVGQLAQARTRVIGLEQQIRMLEASHPILLIEQGLNESIKALNLRAEPALRWTAKQALPAGVQGYIRG